LPIPPSSGESNWAVSTYWPRYNERTNLNFAVSLPSSVGLNFDRVGSAADAADHDISGRHMSRLWFADGATRF
jgi:hypothetical protein